MRKMKKLVAILFIISLIWVSGCVNKDSAGNNNIVSSNITGPETIADNNTEYINNGQVDVISRSEYNTKNDSST